jgi:hypothetical protein
VVDVLDVDADARDRLAVEPEGWVVKSGDLVVYVRDPLLYGVLEIQHVMQSGQLHCEQLGTGNVEIFGPHELELVPDVRRGEDFEQREAA